MAYCGPHGIPHSKFLGWDSADQDKALGWARVQSLTCGGCGTRTDEWDPDLDGDRNAYIGHVSRCEGCARLAQERRNVQAQTKDDDKKADGIKVGLRRREGG